jgi:hypothetical protein
MGRGDQGLGGKLHDPCRWQSLGWCAIAACEWLRKLAIWDTNGPRVFFSYRRFSRCIDPVWPRR